jgi:hypothetical protein
MSIAVHPELNSRIHALAEAQGLTIEAYSERLVSQISRACGNWNLKRLKG